MLNFVIISSNEKNRREYNDIIHKIMMAEEIYYKIHDFNCINKSFNELCETISQSTVFIIDEDSKINSQELLRKIRKEYNLITAFIIIITSNQNKDNNVFELSNKYSFLIDIINNDNSKIKRIESDIKYILKIIFGRKKVFSFIQDKVLYRLPYSDILYFEKEVNSKKTIIITKNNRYHVFRTLNEIQEELDGRFVRTHQSALVNMENVVKIDFNKSIITFSKNIECNLLSRNSKKELKKILTK